VENGFRSGRGRGRPGLRATGERCRRLLVRGLVVASAALALSACAPAAAGVQPTTLTIGTLYAGTGQFAPSSLPELAGLRFWVAQVDRDGGVHLGGSPRRIRVRLLALDDHSSPRLAARLYERLVRVAHVQLLVADFGSVLSAPAIPIAARSQMLLFDQSGSGTSLFLADNPYIVLCDLPTSAIWPDPLVHFLLARRLRRVAIVYGANPFDGAQDATIAGQLTRAGNSPVANIAVPTATRSYGALIASLARLRPDALLELGYQDNDLAFLRQLAQLRRAGDTPGLRVVFTAFPGQFPAAFEHALGAGALAGTFTYGFPPAVPVHGVRFGLSLSALERVFPTSARHPLSFYDLAGYNTGLVMQAALARSASFSQLALRAALNSLSGQLHTVLGTFEIDGQGAQLGETPPVAEFLPSTRGSLALQVVYPPSGTTPVPVRSRPNRSKPAG